MHMLPTLTEKQSILYHNAALYRAKAWKKLQEAHPEGFPSQWVEDTPEWHTARKFIEEAEKLKDE